MGDEIIGNRWDSSTGFLIAMIGAIIGLSGIWKFSYLMYENGGGTFLIPYILAIVIMAIPILVLEFGVGFKFKSSLPKVFYNIKSEFFHSPDLLHMHNVLGSYLYCPKFI